MTVTCASSSALNESDDVVGEYLVGYGVAGEFGRFRSLRPLDVVRGDRTVVRTHRGLELGEVICAARPGHATFLPNTTLGQLLRRATPDDLMTDEQMRQKAAAIFDAARQVVQEQNLPLEILDAEVLLDGEQAVLHYLNWETFDERELVSRMASRFGLRVLLHSLKTETLTGEEHGCGEANCGGGNCSSCGSGGGCGTCGPPTSTELRDHFASLREQMERQGERRTPLA